MSNRDVDQDYTNPQSALSFAIAQSIHQQVRTTVPGIVQHYDPETRRAVVQPALRTLLTDGRRLDPPPIVNVPMCHVAGGGDVIHLTYRAGDAVVILFAQRGLREFKRTLKLADPDVAFFAAKDAIALGCGFSSGPSKPGLSIVREDGSYVQMSGGEIRINAQRIVLAADRVDVVDPD